MGNVASDILTSTFDTKRRGYKGTYNLCLWISKVLILSCLFCRRLWTIEFKCCFFYW